MKNKSILFLSACLGLGVLCQGAEKSSTVLQAATSDIKSAENNDRPLYSGAYGFNFSLSALSKSLSWGDLLVLETLGICLLEAGYAFVKNNIVEAAGDWEKLFALVRLGSFTPDGEGFALLGGNMRNRYEVHRGIENSARRTFTVTMVGLAAQWLALKLYERGQITEEL